MHTTLAVIVDQARDSTHAFKQIMPLLEPYRIDLEVAPYTVWISESQVESVLEWDKKQYGFDVGAEEESNTKHETIASLVGEYYLSDPHKGIYGDGKYGYVTTDNPNPVWDYWKFNNDTYRLMQLHVNSRTKTFKKNFPSVVNESFQAAVARVDNIDFATTRVTKELTIPLGIIVNGKHIQAEINQAYFDNPEMWESIYYDQIVPNLDPKSWMLLIDVHS